MVCECVLEMSAGVASSSCFCFLDIGYLHHSLSKKQILYFTSQVRNFVRSRDSKAAPNMNPTSSQQLAVNSASRVSPTSAPPPSGQSKSAQPHLKTITPSKLDS